jgi:hypothetical protein
MDLSKTTTDLNEEDLLYGKKDNEEVNYFSDDKFI